MRCDIAFSPRTQPLAQVTGVDVPGDLLDACKPLGQGLEDLLLALLPVTHVPAHQLRTTWWEDNRAMAWADGVVWIRGQQVQGLHIAREVAHGRRRGAQNTVTRKQDTVGFEVKGHVVYFVSGREDGLHCHIASGLDQLA